MINWGYPKRGDRFNTVDDYIGDYIDDIVDHVREGAGVDKLNLFGICMGGIRSPPATRPASREGA